MEKALPNNWVETDLMSLSSVSTGKKDANHAEEDGAYSFYTCALTQSKSPSFSFDGPSVIVPGNGNIGYVFFYDGKFEAYQRTYVINDIKIEPKFLYYHFQFFWKRRTVDNLYGSTIQYVKIGNFREYSITFSPLPEQQRIVAKLDSLFAHLEQVKTRLEKVPELLKTLKEAALQKSFSGELTLQWRKEHACSSIEEMIEASKSSIMDKKAVKFFSKEIDDSEKVVNIPESWVWTRLAGFTEIAGGLTKGGKTKQDTIELPYLRVANVQRGYLDLGQVKYVHVPKTKAEKIYLKQGDVLFNEGGDIDKLGRGWIWENQIKNCVHQNHVFRARLINEKFEPKYLSHYGNSLAREYFIREGSQTVNLANINKTTLSHLPVPLAPVEEQTEIIRRLDLILSNLDLVEKKYLKLKSKLEDLPQAILAKAFKGELVKQLPTDGDARELLEEIRMLKESEKKTSHRKNKQLAH